MSYLYGHSLTRFFKSCICYNCTTLHSLHLKQWLRSNCVERIVVKRRVEIILSIISLVTRSTNFRSMQRIVFCECNYFRRGHPTKFLRARLKTCATDHVIVLADSCLRELSTVNYICKHIC